MNVWNVENLFSKDLLLNNYRSQNSYLTPCLSCKINRLNMQFILFLSNRMCIEISRRN